MSAFPELFMFYTVDNNKKNNNNNNMINKINKINKDNIKNYIELCEIKPAEKIDQNPDIENINFIIYKNET
jgi:hypothetical protein